ncbi:MAG TPA: imidazoleglycerol-phosphate dehydratase HisB [Firmicutes bacterium]|jgi:imidazoleglycerol-phosphate dehydratase|nr:MAG: imidazoleglycerol-phosphate dehydratase [Peptococcaceae bacterium 1109]HHT73796.1 imidazoleglycerol-phosphate dehydratase HisB [Bacillota bacterium]
MRTAQLQRKTAETAVEVSLSLDGAGQALIDTGIGFFDHMLHQVARHGLFDMTIKCKGDLNVDAHHTVEDVGITFGKAFTAALGDKAGIARYGTAITPMDDALTLVALDLSGRPYLGFDVAIPAPSVGQFDTELVEEFFRAFANHAQATIHIRLLAGSNSHHIIESVFKGFGRALDQATCRDHRILGVPSTKKTL